MDGLIAWAKSNSANRRAFYTQLFAKLLPMQVSANVSATIRRIEPGMTDQEAIDRYFENVRRINGVCLGGYIEQQRAKARA